MYQSVPTDPQEVMLWDWEDFAPYFAELQAAALSSETVNDWLAQWSLLGDAGYEILSRLSVDISVDTTDTQAEQRYKAFFDTLYPRLMEAEQALKVKLLESGLEPEGFAIPLRNMRAEADLFRQENLPVIAEENKRKTDYDKIVGAQTVVWEGEERTISQMQPVFQEPDRGRREQAWRLVAERQLADRDAINAVWADLLQLRLKIAKNAGRPDYRAYRWQEMLRFDYTPDDAKAFQDAIEQAVVPAAQRIYAHRQQRLGLPSLRPWDLDVDVRGLPPLRPFDHRTSLTEQAGRIFQNVDQALGGYFATMVNENLLDLYNRKNKAPGAYCTDYPMLKRPFIFENAVGMHEDVQTLLHESGHAFHVFESAHLPYHLRNVPTEFAEVASMSMELLAAPYLTRDQGGFYSEAEAARARIDHLEGSILFWPYMAVVDAFQHWVYENPEQAANPAECDAAWARQWQRFMKGVDWSGLEEVMSTGWHRKLHIHTYPFYYVEYGLAQLGAVQVWGNALKDQTTSVANYRKALRLGGSVTLPELFQTAGARFAFDAPTLQNAVQLMEQTIEKLEQQI